MKRRELEQASIDAASDLLDTDSNATFAMVSSVLLSKILLESNQLTLSFVPHKFVSRQS